MQQNFVKHKLADTGHRCKVKVTVVRLHMEGECDKSSNINTVTTVKITCCLDAV